MEEKRCHVTHFDAPSVSAVIGPRRGWSSTAPHDPISNESRSSERTRHFLFLRRTTVSRHSRSNEHNPSSISGFVVSSFAEIAALSIAACCSHACFHQQHADLVFNLHHLPDQQVAVPQRAPPSRMAWRTIVALRQKINSAGSRKSCSHQRDRSSFRPPQWPAASAGMRYLSAAACGCR